MIKVKTYTPKEIKTQPDNIVVMEDIISYWSQEGSNFNYELYLKILRTKIFAK